MINDYTTTQRKSIVSAVQYGREMLSELGASPLVFFDHFMQLGGLHVPSELTPTARKWKIANLVLAKLERSDDGSVPGGLTTEEINTAMREAMRAVTETQWVGIGGSEGLSGFQLHYRHYVADVAACEEYLRTCVDCIGFGIWPVFAIAVLPPCCDGATFRPLFQYEKTIPDLPSRRAPDMQEAEIDALLDSLRGSWKR